MKNHGTTILGFGLVTVAAAIVFTAHGAFSRFDKADAIVKTLPPLLERAEAVSDKMIAASHELKISAGQAKEALPEVGSKFGEAGANALRNFADKYRSKDGGNSQKE